MIRPLVGFIFGLSTCLLFTFFAGENPLVIVKILLGSAFGSAYDLGLCLFYATSFIFTGLSVSLAFRAGLFNIGAEGQLTVATMAAAIGPLALPELNYPMAPLLATLLAMIVGGLWALIPALLKVWRGSHEVVVTMMMNFIAAGITSYLIVAYFQNPESQNPETTPVPPAYLLANFDPVAAYFVDSPANLSLVVALLLCLIYYFVLNKTKWGFELTATGKNQIAAEYAGVNSQNVKIIALTLAGAIAGLVAMNEVLGSAGKFKIGFSAEYGFVGIAVALLARNHPLGIIVSAFLFAVLQKGSTDLDIETETITRDFSKIMQAVIILSVTAFSLINFKRWKKNGR